MRAMFWAGGVVVALAVLIGAGRLGAEGKDKKAVKPEDAGTRIALINLTYVIKSYDKYKHFREDIKKACAPLEAAQKELSKEAEELQKQVTPNNSQERKAQIEHKLKVIQRNVEDTQAEAKRVLGKKSDEMMKNIYMDVMEAAARYAVAHNLDLVLQYNDETNEQDLLSPMSIARKIQTGGLRPLYAAPGMDISMELVKILNENAKQN